MTIVIGLYGPTVQSACSPVSPEPHPLGHPLTPIRRSSTDMDTCGLATVVIMHILNNVIWIGRFKPHRPCQGLLHKVKSISMGLKPISSNFIGRTCLQAHFNKLDFACERGPESIACCMQLKLALFRHNFRIGPLRSNHFSILCNCKRQTIPF